MARAPGTSLRAMLRRQWVLSTALIAMMAICAIGIVGYVRTAGILLAILIGVLGIVRLVLPVHEVGALAVRTRAIDVTVMLGLGLILLVLSFTPNL